MSEQDTGRPEEAGQNEAPAVVVQAGLASATGTAPQPENEPDTEGEG
jgi:hypothetical protein